MEQTAVEYTIQEIEKLAGIKISRDEDCIEKANKMFEQQIIEAHAVGRLKECSGINTDGEQYYNQIFKQQEQ